MLIKMIVIEKVHAGISIGFNNPMINIELPDDSEFDVSLLCASIYKHLCDNYTESDLKDIIRENGIFISVYSKEEEI